MLSYAHMLRFPLQNDKFLLVLGYLQGNIRFSSVKVISTFISLSLPIFSAKFLALTLLFILTHHQENQTVAFF